MSFDGWTLFGVRKKQVTLFALFCGGRPWINIHLSPKTDLTFCEC